MDYGTEVRLLAVTSIEENEVLAGTSADYQEATPESESLIEYAGRLCTDTLGKLGTKPGWIQQRIKDGHESILEHGSITVYIRASRVFTHELVRHRIASYSQRSQRYVKETEPRYITPPGFTDEQDREFLCAMSMAWECYAHMLDLGVPKEIARYVLPGACETQIVMTANFREWIHIIRLRTCRGALPEMREVMGKTFNILRRLAPQVFNLDTCGCKEHRGKCLQESIPG